jgi:hypothetical protein
MTTAAVAQPRRELTSLTAEPERRLLLFLAARVPARIGPDHLTALGLLAMLAAGVAYAFSSRWPFLLLAVNGALALNWLGDSLDGNTGPLPAAHASTLRLLRRSHGGRLRRSRAPPGLAASGWMAAWLAVSLLIAYLLLSVNIALAACSRGTFKISYGPFGGTELRLLMALGNTVVWLWPQAVVAGHEVMLFDVMGGIALLGVVAALLRSTAQNTCALYALERL